MLRSNEILYGHQNGTKFKAAIYSLWAPNSAPCAIQRVYIKDLFKTPGHLIRSIATQNKWKSSYFQQNWLLYTLVLVNSPMCTGSKNQVPNRLKIQFVELDFYKLIYQKFGFISLENMVCFDRENKSKKSQAKKTTFLAVVYINKFCVFLKILSFLKDSSS